MELISVVETGTAMSYDAWLLRTSVGCAGPLFSWTMNADLSKITVASNFTHKHAWFSYITIIMIINASISSIDHASNTLQHIMSHPVLNELSQESLVFDEIAKYRN